MSGFTSRPLYPRVNNTGTNWTGGWVVPELVWTLWRGENPALLGPNPGSPARSPSLCRVVPPLTFILPIRRAHGYRQPSACACLVLPVCRKLVCWRGEWWNPSWRPPTIQYSTAARLLLHCALLHQAAACRNTWWAELSFNSTQLI
jgi:hypothetical protein